MVDPAREQPTRCSSHGHAGDVACPAQQPSVVVGVQRFDSKALIQLCRGDTMSARVKSVDTAHRAHTCVVEIAHSPEEVLSQTPAFAAIEQNGKA